MRTLPLIAGSLCLCLLPVGLFAEEATLRAGAAAVDVSPREFPLNMPGGFSANLAESVHDPLHARALAFDDGGTSLAILLVDSLGVHPEVQDEAKAAASEKTGIPVERILICSTHTHSGPGSNGKEGAAAAYRRVLLEGMVEAIARAHGNLQPARIGHASHPLPEEVFNRRWYLKPGKMAPNPFGKFDKVRTNPGTNPEVLDRPAGPTDPDVAILSVQDAKRKPLALFANYALHYVGHIPPGQVSADYFGEFARLMPARLRAGEGFVAMLSNGASGDINNIPFLVARPPREPFEQVRIVAQKTADAAWRAHRKIDSHSGQARLGMSQREVVLQYRRPSAEQVAEAEAVLALTDPAAVEALPRLAKNYARSVVSASKREERELAVKLQAIRIGDLAICGIPFETFVETGLELKRRSPFRQTIVVGMANVKYGYLLTPEQHAFGGYETWLGTCQLAEDSSTILTAHLLEMLEALKSQD